MKDINTIRLRANDDDENTVEGTLITAGEVTTGTSGITKVWPKSTLSASLDSLEGVPLIHTHEETVRNTVGKITKAWMDGDRLRFRATLYDSELYEKIRNGLSSVSLGGRHESVEQMEENDDGAKIVAGPLRFRHVALVTSPAAKSATVSPAEVPGVGNYDESTPSGEAIAAALSTGEHAFALETGSIDEVNEGDKNEDDESTMTKIEISESTKAQLREIRTGQKDFDDTTTADEIISWLASEVVTTEDEVAAEQARLRRKFGYDGDGSDVKLDRQKGTAGRENTELTASERDEVKQKQEELRQKYQNR